MNSRADWSHLPWIATHLEEGNSDFKPTPRVPRCHHSMLIGHGCWAPSSNCRISLRAPYFTPLLFSENQLTCPRHTTNHYKSPATIEIRRIPYTENVIGSHSLDTTSMLPRILVVSLPNLWKLRLSTFRVIRQPYFGWALPAPCVVGR